MITAKGRFRAIPSPWMLFLPLLVLSFVQFSPQSRSEEPSLQNRIYSMRDMDLDEARTMFSSVITSRGKVYILRQQRRILVQDEPAGLQRADELYAMLTAPEPNVRIEFSSNEVSSESYRGFEPNVSIRGNKIRVRAIYNDQMGSGNSLSQQFLLVRNGGAASIEIGRWVPVPRYFYRLCVGWGLIPADVTYEFIGRALQIRPQIHGNLIDLEITPVLTALVDHKPTTIELRTLTTRVTLQNGSTVQIGGFNEADADFNRRFFAIDRGNYVATGSFTVRATIEPPGTSSGNVFYEPRRLR